MYVLSRFSNFTRCKTDDLHLSRLWTKFTYTHLPSNSNDLLIPIYICVTHITWLHEEKNVLVWATRYVFDATMSANRDSKATPFISLQKKSGSRENVFKNLISVTVANLCQICLSVCPSVCLTKKGFLVVVSSIIPKECNNTAQS